jgi:hypothetical protein
MAGFQASAEGPDGGGELVSNSRFVSFRWVSEGAHGVSVQARLAASVGPFVGMAYLTFGPCCFPNQSTGEIAQAAFTVTSQTPADVLLFENLTLPPSNYYLTLAGTGPRRDSGWWRRPSAP